MKKTRGNTRFGFWEYKTEQKGRERERERERERKRLFANKTPKKGKSNECYSNGPLGQVQSSVNKTEFSFYLITPVREGGREGERNKMVGERK